MKKVLITGANGFLGANLAWQLFKQGYGIKVLVRPGADLRPLTGMPLDISYGRIDHAEQVLEAQAGCNYVVHAAAITDQWGIGFEEYDRINFKGTRNVVEACLAHSIEKLIHVSTANTIGPGTKSNPATEWNGFSLFKANSGYINTKYLAQQYVLEQVQARRLPAVIVNPTFMIGPHDHKPSSGKLLLHGLNKKIVWYPPGGKNFVFIDDVCKGIISALHKGQTGACYLLAGHNLTYGEFYRLLRQHSQQKQLMIRMPRLLLMAAGLLGSTKGLITGRPGRLTWSSAYLLSMSNYYSGKKASTELNVEYTPMETAITTSLDWFRANNYF